MGKHHTTEVALQILLLAMLGVVLRIVCASDALWLDEIWSQNLLRSVTDPFQILLLHSDNNHPLNSLWLWFIGPDALSISARALSLAAGAALLWDLRRAVREGILPLFSALMIIAAYPLVLYGSEARGYMPMLLGLWICWRTVARALAGNGNLGLGDGISLTFGALLGAVSHGTFLYWYPAILVWAAVGSGRFRGANLFAALPGFAVCVTAYLSFFRLITPGTGPMKPTIQVIIDALSVVAGGPELTENSMNATIWGIVAAVLVFTLAIAELWALMRAGKREWIFFLLAIVLLPALSLMIHSPRVIFIRYFLPSIFTLYLLLGSFLQRLYDRDAGGRIVSVLLGLALLGSNLFWDYRLARLGRGDPVGVIEFMLYMQRDEEIVVSGDHIFRDTMVLDRFKAEVSEGSRVRYEDNGSAPWRLVSSQDPFFRPLKTLEDGRYDLVASFESAPLSGWSWYLYRRRR